MNKAVWGILIFHYERVFLTTSLLKTRSEISDTCGNKLASISGLLLGMVSVSLDV